MEKKRERGKYVAEKTTKKEVKQKSNIKVNGEEKKYHQKE